MSEVWIKAYSIKPWMNSSNWIHFFAEMENILSAKLTNLDAKDPPRRKVERFEFEALGNFITAFGQKEEGRWIFGRFREVKVELTLLHFKNPRSSERDFPNSLTIYLPSDFCGSQGALAKIEQIFDLINNTLCPFYSFSDLEDLVAKKKKPQGAVNIQEELIGVFWLTYFNQKYVEYFGRNRFPSGLTEFISNGAKIKLGATPGDVSEQERIEFENLLGRESFVDSSSFLTKQPGKAALSFPQLQDGMQESSPPTTERKTEEP